MSRQDLASRLYQVACQSLGMANAKSPFVANKQQAMQDINRARKLLTVGVTGVILSSR